MSGDRHNLVAAYTQLGMRLSEIKRYQESLANFFFALQLSPSDITRKNFAIAWVSLQASNAEGTKQRPSAAIVRQSLQMGLALSECLNAYGATLASLGDTEGAQRAFEQAVQADPETQLARENLARLKMSRESLSSQQINFGLTEIEAQPMAAR